MKISIAVGVGIIAAAQACGSVPSNEESNSLGAAESAVNTAGGTRFVTGTYTQNGQSGSRVVNCADTEYLVGVGVDWVTNRPIAKCATAGFGGTTLRAPFYNGNGKLPPNSAGVWPNALSPACANTSNDAAVGYTQTFTSTASTNTLRCGMYPTSRGNLNDGSYADGPGAGTWGQEVDTINGHSVTIHTCARGATYVIRGYDFDQDELWCGT